MQVPNRGRSRSALGRYNLRQNLVPPLRYSVDYSGPVNPSRDSRNSAGMATEGLTLDHSRNSFRSSSEVDSDETIAEIVASTSGLQSMSAYSDNINVEAAMSILTSSVETTSTTAPARLQEYRYSL